MKLNSYSLIILCLIVSIIPASYSYQACSSYKPNFEADCSSLSDKTKTCRYKYKQCICDKIQCSDLDTKDKCENYYIDQMFSQICVYDNEKGVFNKKNYAPIGVLYMEEIIAQVLQPQGQTLIHVDITMANA